MINSYTRRQLLCRSAQTTAALAGLSVVSSPLLAMIGTTLEPIPPVQDSRVKELVERALDAARQAGAEYADVRLTYTRGRKIKAGGIESEVEVLHTGVRALVQGYWGFASSALWHPEEMVRLGREATQLARYNVSFAVRDMDFLAIPTDGITQGHWETPVRIDAFSVHPQEIRDYLSGIGQQLENEVAKLQPHGMKEYHEKGGAICEITKQEKAFGGTDGRYYTQILHRTGGGAGVDNYERDIENRSGHDDGVLTFTGAGWETFLDAPIVEAVRRTMIERMEMARLPEKPIDIGRHVTVFDAFSMAQLVSQTIGAATQIDRALGYEANAGGTSYLNSPDEMLDTFILGTPQLTVTANRSEAGGLATTRWDDEGMPPKDAVLLRNGILKDFQTSREGAGWLRQGYTRIGRPVQSGGYMFANDALSTPLIHTGNIHLTGSSAALSHQDLEAGIDQGLSVVGLRPSVDFQLAGGEARRFECYELRRGKRTARIPNAGILFRTSEIWKGLSVLGGDNSARRYGIIHEKGEPEQRGFHTATAVPAVVRDVTFIDRMGR